MTAINQGWFISCDGCGLSDNGSIHDGGPRTKEDAEDDVRRAGWIFNGSRHYCGEECMRDHQVKIKKTKEKRKP